MKSLILFFLSSLSLTIAFSFPWIAVGEAPKNEYVEFIVALKQYNLDQLTTNLLQTSDPESSFYGLHWTKEEIINLVAPPQEHSGAVVSYFETKCNGVDIQNYRDALKVRAPVYCIEQIFQVKMQIFQHLNDKEVTVIKRQRDGYGVQIPSEISEFVEFVSGISELPRDYKKSKNIKKQNPDKLEGPIYFDYVIPKTIRRIYNVPESSTIQNPLTSQAIVEFTGEGAVNFNDLITFAKLSDEIFTNITHIIGDWDTDDDATYSTLEYEYQSTLAPGADQYYITFDKWIYELSVFLFNLPKTPLVNSISLGCPEQFSCEYSDCDGIDWITYVERANVEMQKLGLNGITLIASTGEDGAPSGWNSNCDGNLIYPIFPASSPWVTSVSSTTLIDKSHPTPSNDPPICEGYQCAQGNHFEEASMGNNTIWVWTTGGGFSVISPTPAYQQGAIQEWLNTNAIRPPKNFYNSTNRGYPDISAVGTRLIIYYGGASWIGEGTSAQIISALVSLLNDYRISHGKSSLGFINPLLYKMYASNSSTFQDVTIGVNNCSSDKCCAYGYGASEGWDPITGLGTPNYQEMLRYVSQLP